MQDLVGCLRSRLASASPAFLQLQKAWVRGGLICCTWVRPKACSPLSKTRVQGRGRERRPHRHFGSRGQGEPDGTTQIAHHLGRGQLERAAFPAPGQPRHVTAGEGSPAAFRASDTGDASQAPALSQHPQVPTSRSSPRLPEEHHFTQTPSAFPITSPAGSTSPSPILL